MSGDEAAGARIAAEIRELLARPGHVAEHAAELLPRLRTDIDAARSAGALDSDPFVDRAIEDLATALAVDERGRRSGKSADAARRILSALAHALG